MITRLRQKIEPDPKNPKYLQTVRGNGYVLWTD
jgi:two-component system, OmpR family, phosphate regulon response regulator OmpR